MMVSLSNGVIVAFLLHQASSAVTVQGASYASEPLSLQDESVEAKIHRALAQQQSVFSAQQKSQEKKLRLLLQNTVESQQEMIEALDFELQQVKAAGEASGRRRSDAVTGRRANESKEGDYPTSKGGKKGGSKGHTSVCWSDPSVGDGPPSVFVDLDVEAGVYKKMRKKIKKGRQVRLSCCDESYIVCVICRCNFLIFPFYSCFKVECREWIRSEP
jgi:hypothetical protein